MKVKTLIEWLDQFDPHDDIPLETMDEFYAGDFGIASDGEPIGDECPKCGYDGVEITNHNPHAHADNS